MTLPTRHDAHALLKEYVSDTYQQFHAQMVASAMHGYADLYDKDTELWYITGLLHDLDYEHYPNEHPAHELMWFRQWGYPEEMIHAIEAHAYGHNGFTTLPQSTLAAALLASDEITGIFYAYQKLNPVSFSEMKPSSIKKRFNEKDFAAGVDREIVQYGCDELGISLEEHVENLIRFFCRS